MVHVAGVDARVGDRDGMGLTPELFRMKGPSALLLG
jgi:hypothetical protein